ncbi:MAG: glycerate kinase type-2 family protein [Nitrosopumilus sp.]
MIIQNFEDLSDTSRKRECLEILEKGLEAANPQNIIPDYLFPNEIKIGSKSIKLNEFSNIYTVAFGKAGDSMTRAVNAIIPVKAGIIVIPKGSKSLVKGKKFQIFNSKHPQPDKTSVKAAKEIIKFLSSRKSDELVVFLVSGGGSSLVALPDKITLEDKIFMTNLLLKTGASIQEINCVRKHISKIKGGKILESMRCKGISLVMSDVEGDDLSSIASGTTFADNTTYKDALDVLEKYNLRKKTPIEVLNVLEQGVDKESVKAEPIENVVIANNQLVVSKMKQAAIEKGYQVKLIEIYGDIKEQVRKIVENISEEEKTCLIFGGEPTVKVLGKGMGGRNQELVLRILKNTQKLKKIVIASMGTDGIDGNSVFAGAITENMKFDSEIIKEFLKNSDSGRFFQKQKSNIVTGFTHTNLQDIGVILR